MGKIATAAGAAFMMVIVLIGAASAGVASIFGLGSDGNAAPSTQAMSQIPPQYYLLFTRAAAECPGLSWTVLAGIAKEESDFGRAADQVSKDGALGPMQFLPDTFDQYAQPVPPGGATPASLWDPTDAVFAAARMLCANGARNKTDIHAAVYAYNHSDAYVTAVLADAATFAQGAPAAGGASGGPLPTAPGPAQAAAIAFAQSQLGVKYVWGAEEPGVAFDCSGLVQAAYAAAGVHLPRVATDQYNATTPVPVGAPLLPGDLVYYGTAPHNLEHIGIYIGNGLMIDAPNPSAPVRVEPFRYTGDNYAGVTRVVAK
ncbi:MAG: NlpC/P60 family protein [Catenulispora sp.]